MTYVRTHITRVFRLPGTVHVLYCWKRASDYTGIYDSAALYSIVAVQTRNRYKELSKYDNGDCVIPGLGWVGQSFDVMGGMEPWFGYSQSVFHVP
jgi:hypothetical protein